MPLNDHPDQVLARVIERQQSRFYGKYGGLVTQIGESPEGIPCCIKARVPDVFGADEETPWARPCAPFAGSSSGFVYLPEIGDNVWIEFEAGDISRPIWVGGWWSSGKRPSPEGDTVRLIATKAGHQLVLDEDSDKVVLRHPSGAEITLDADGIVLKFDPCEVKITRTEVSINQGMAKITLAGASLVHDAFKVGA